MDNKRWKLFFRISCGLSLILAMILLPFSAFYERQASASVIEYVVEVDEECQGVDYSAFSVYDPRGFGDDGDDNTFNYLPEVRNQGSIGLCWAYAVAGSLEINLNKNFGVAVDIAEKYLAYFTKNGYDSNTQSPTFGDGQSYSDGTNIDYNQIFNGGGSFEGTMNTLLAGWGMQSQDYVDRTTSLNEYLQIGGGINWENYRLSDVAKVVGYVEYGGSESLDTIKDEIVDKGSVIVSVQMENLHANLYNSSNYSYYASSESYSGTDHMVEIVGWSDSYSASNFKIRPAGNGAWLVRNSWGNTWGDGGYFWVSYYDLGIKSSGYKTIEVEALANRDVLYQYDCGTSVLASLSSGSSTPITYANVFQNGTQRKQDLKSVGLYISTGFEGGAQNVEIKIYTASGKMSSPTMGTLMRTLTRTFSNDGFYKVDIGEKIVIDKGCSFSVVVTNSSTVKAYACFEGSGGVLQDGIGCEYRRSSAGQSFMKNGSWNDSSSPLGGYTYNNAGIKAYASYSECIEHNYDSGIHTEKTCKAYGYTTYTCRDCGHTKVEQDIGSGLASHSYVPAGHTDGTCQSYGYTTHVCIWCGETKRVDDTDYGSHNFVNNYRVNGNCESKGYIVERHCLICGINEGQKTYDADFGAHSYKEVERIHGDCCNYSKIIYECEVCHDEKIETDENSGYGKHKYSQVVIANGEKKIYCEVVGCDRFFVVRDSGVSAIIDESQNEKVSFSLESYSSLPQELVVNLKNGVLKINTALCGASVSSYYDITIEFIDFNSLQNNGGLSDKLSYFSVTCLMNGIPVDGFEVQINFDTVDCDAVEFLKIERGEVTKNIAGTISDGYVIGTLNNGIFGISISKNESVQNKNFVFSWELVYVAVAIGFVILIGEMAARGRRKKKKEE